MPDDFAVGIEHGERQHRARRLQPEPAVDLLAHVFGLGTEVYQSFHSSPSFTASVSPSHWSCDKRLQPRMRTAQRHRFKPGHRILPSPHPEERFR